MCFELRKCTYEKTTEANRLIAQYEYVDYYALYPNKYWILRKIPVIIKAAEKLNTNDFTDLQIESGYTDYAMDTINFYLHKLGLVKSYDPRVKKFDFDKEAIEKWKYYKCSPYWQLYNEAGYKVIRCMAIVCLCGRLKDIEKSVLMTMMYGFAMLWIGINPYASNFINAIIPTVTRIRISVMSNMKN